MKVFIRQYAVYLRQMAQPAVSPSPSAGKRLKRSEEVPGMCERGIEEQTPSGDYKRQS